LTNDNKPYSKWESKQSFFPEIQPESLKQIRLQIEEILGEGKKNNNIDGLMFDFLNNTYNKLPNQIFKDFEGQIEPLGIYGEGLFKLLKYFASYETEKINEIKSYLKLFDWFKDFTIPEGLSEGESFLQIKDRYLDNKIKYFDQKSSNEGFLFVLFYFSLLISDKTPSFFAIDNIEASLNPKLCTKLIKNISELTKKHKKQVIVTTHSPSVLDGLNLNDKEQKLFLVYRNKFGRTIVKQIEKPQPIEGQEPVKLSEAFLRGYIGGLPKNFAI